MTHWCYFFLLPVASETSVTHLAIALCTPIFLSYHILMSSVIYHRTDAWQHGTYLLNALNIGTIHNTSNVNYLILTFAFCAHAI